uniref:Uncharacterized protein n=1 Tax=Rhizophora mucronata TaxID=61149 RepID=A0A2P2R284_RHIMU
MVLLVTAYSRKLEQNSIILLLQAPVSHGVCFSVCLVQH